MGFGSFFKKIGKTLGKVASSPIGQIGLSFIPGVGGLAAGLAAKALAPKNGGMAAQGMTVMPGVGAVATGFPSFGGGFMGNIAGQLMKPKGFTGAQARAFASSQGFVTGQNGRRYRRMNYMNIRAARRAIRRVKGARKLLKGIEAQLPRRASVNRRAFRRR